MLAQMMRRLVITGPKTVNQLAYFEVRRTQGSDKQIIKHNTFFAN